MNVPFILVAPLKTIALYTHLLTLVNALTSTN